MQNNIRPTRRPIRWILAAAIAGPVTGMLGASSASAQYQVPADGSAHDANNRVGSAGKHYGPPGPRGTLVTQNQIIYGNVTNNKEFRGPTGSTDARAFRGNLSTNVSDRFIRASAGGYDRATLAEAYETRPFYGNSRGVVAPANYVPTVTTGTNVYTAGLTTFGQPLNGATLATLNTGEGLIPRLGTTTTIIGGPTDERTGAPGSFVVLSPLAGIRQVSPDQLRTYTIPTGTLAPGPSNAGDRFRGDFVDRVRSENGDQRGPGSPSPTGPGGTNPGGAPGDAPAPIPGGPQPLNKPLSAPVESPANAPLGGAAGSPTGAPLNSGQPLSSGISTGQTLRRQYTVPTAPNQQVSELEKRYRQATGGDQPKTDQQAAQEFRDTKPLNAGNPAAVPPAPGTPRAPGTPGTPAVPGAPGGPTPVPGAPATPPAPAIPSVTPPSSPPAPGAEGAKAEPLVITSLATGVKSPTLAGMLRQAEDDMKQGKFTDALEKYTLAEQASPMDPLIALGRTNAELGGSSYRTAETHLRQAFAGNEALLMGKYDLQAMIGKDRVETLVRDLKDLSAKEPQEPMAPFLLAYVHYNTGNEAEAAAQLAEVVKREGGTADPVVKAMQQRWALPGGNLNK